MISPMKTSHTLWVCAALLLGTACSDVTFTEPVPLHRRNLPAFPKAWHGQWKDAGGDVYTIEAGGFNSSDAGIDPILLGEGALLRRFHGYLVLNQTSENGHVEVLLAKRKKNRVFLYQFDATDEKAIAVWREVLAAEISAISVSDLESESYVLSPKNNAAFRQLIMKGGLTPMGELVQIGA